jgi:hypothetical protein
MFEIAGGELSIAHGWRHGEVYDKGEQFIPGEIGEVVHDLLKRAPDVTPVYGA